MPTAKRVSGHWHPPLLSPTYPARASCYLECSQDRLCLLSTPLRAVHLQLHAAELAEGEPLLCNGCVRSLLRAAHKGMVLALQPAPLGRTHHRYHLQLVRYAGSWASASGHSSRWRLRSRRCVAGVSGPTRTARRT